MTDKTDIILFAYSLVVVGLVIGLRMLYVGSVQRRALDLGGKQIQPRQLVSAGGIFASAGALSAAVMIVEILSGAAGTVLWPFIVATLVVPAVVLLFVARR